jgi:hypothetical protein
MDKPCLQAHAYIGFYSWYQVKEIFKAKGNVALGIAGAAMKSERFASCFKIADLIPGLEMGREKVVYFKFVDRLGFSINILENRLLKELRTYTSLKAERSVLSYEMTR